MTGAPNLSVFTPSHDPRHLDACLASLLAQTRTDWEWVVLLNGKARDWRPPAEDDRVSVHRASPRTKGVGALKRAACALTTAPILVELDHDDILASTALVEIAAAFTSRPAAAVVYSDFAQIDERGGRDDTRFTESNGWRYAEDVVDGRRVLRCHALAASPHNVSYVWYAPNHVRAFRRQHYDAVGGYDERMDILDDQDLLMRLFEAGPFVHVPKCLYLQRRHARNTQSRVDTNARIQQETVRLYQEGVAALAVADARRRGLAIVALRCPTTIGTSPLAEAPGARALEVAPAKPELPFADGSVAVIEAHDVLQRMPDRAAILNECYRVLCHAGLLLSMTPSTDGRGAFQDPSHVAFYNENSFDYLTQAALRPTVPTLKARFQVSHLRTFYPSPTHEQVFTPYVQANLLAIKEGPRQGGPLLV